MKMQPTFAPAFFAPFGDAVSPPMTPTPVQKPVLFSDDKYHGTSMQQFMASPDFERCQREYGALLDRVVDFAEKNAAHAIRKPDCGCVTVPYRLLELSAPDVHSPASERKPVLLRVLPDALQPALVRTMTIQHVPISKKPTDEHSTGFYSRFFRAIWRYRGIDREAGTGAKARTFF